MTMNIIVTGDEQLTARFSRIGPQLHAGLLSEITEISEDLENYIKNDKLLGQVLNQRSGALRESIHNDVTDQGSTITGRIFSAAPMPVPRPMTATPNACMPAAHSPIDRRFPRFAISVSGKMLFFFNVSGVLLPPL